MNNVSARSLGEAEEKRNRHSDDPNEAQKQLEDEERWEELGGPLKRKMYRDLLFRILPPHKQALYVHTYGWPDKERKREVTPLEGVSQRTAATVWRLYKALTFSRGAWARSHLWTQLNEGDAKARLEASAKGKS